MLKIWNISHPNPGAKVKAGTLLIEVPPVGESVDLMQVINRMSFDDPKQYNAMIEVTRKRLKRIEQFTGGKLSTKSPQAEVVPTGISNELLVQMQKQMEQMQAIIQAQAAQLAALEKPAEPEVDSTVPTEDEPTEINEERIIKGKRK